VLRLLTCLDNVVWGDVGKAGEAPHGCRLHGNPHVDEILGERHRLVVAGDADGAVEVGGRVPVLTVGDADHRTRELPDLGHLGAALADDASDELVGDGHLVGLLGVRRPPLAAQHRQRCRVEEICAQGVAVHCVDVHTHLPNLGLNRGWIVWDDGL